MSTTLFWRPTYPNDRSLPAPLKRALRQTLGTFRSDCETDMGYLRGLADAEVEGAQKLLDLVVKHESVTVREDC